MYCTGTHPVADGSHILVWISGRPRIPEQPHPGCVGIDSAFTPDCLVPDGLANKQILRQTAQQLVQSGVHRDSRQTVTIKDSRNTRQGTRVVPLQRKAVRQHQIDGGVPGLRA